MQPFSFELSPWVLRVINPFLIDSSGIGHVACPVMSDVTMIDRELAAAAMAWKNGNEGKARVCARRAVASAAEAWLARFPERLWCGDAMEHLRRIQQQEAFPSPVQQAAERLTTAVTKRHDAPFTSDPIGDARLIVGYLAAATTDRRLA
ncbi:MAG: hypothetical protein WBO50_03135 [Nitrospira sp.]